MFPDPCVRYKIVPAVQDRLALNVAIRNQKNIRKGNIILWEYKGAPNQLFYFKKVDASKFNIINAATLFALTIENH